MADLIDFPSDQKSLDDLPEPGEDYRAFGPPTLHPHISLIFVFPDGSMEGLRFSALDQFDYTPADSLLGLDLFNLRFCLKELIDVRLEGRNLHELCSYIGEHQVRWLQMLDEGQAIKDQDAPVITRIIIKRHDANIGAENGTLSCRSLYPEPAMQTAG